MSMRWRSHRSNDPPTGNIGTLGQRSPTVKTFTTNMRSNASSPPPATGLYASPENSDDMHDILSPSFDSLHDGGQNDNNLANGSVGHRSIGSSYSADSIIRRVEEEIAAARKAASNVKIRDSEACLLPSDSMDLSVSSDKKMIAALSPGSNAKQKSSVRASRDPSPVTLRSTQYPASGQSIDKYTHAHVVAPTTIEARTRDATDTHNHLAAAVSPKAGNLEYDGNDRPKGDRIPSLATRSEERNSDDDMHDILGVNDNDEEEKKSSFEPTMRTKQNASGLVDSDIQSPNTSHHAKQTAGTENFSGERFDKIDFLRRKVNGDHAMAPMSERQLDDSKSGIRTQRSGSVTGSTAGTEPIYFTDEDWQVRSESSPLNGFTYGSGGDVSDAHSGVTETNVASPESITSKRTNERSSAGSRDAFQILEKSSTEDAIVSSKHHPVFRKRVSAADSIIEEIVQSSASVSKKTDKTGGHVTGPYVKAMVEAIDSPRDANCSSPSSPKLLVLKRTTHPGVQSPVRDIGACRSNDIRTNEQGSHSGKNHISLYQEIVALSGSSPGTNDASIGMLAGKLSELTSSLGRNDGTNDIVSENEIDNKNEIHSALAPEIYDSTIAKNDEGKVRDSLDLTADSNDTTFVHDNKSDMRLNESPLVSPDTRMSSPQDTVYDSTQHIYNATSQVSPSNCTGNPSSEWDKASELLTKLKEQRVSFSSTFSPVHAKTSDLSPSSQWYETKNENVEDYLQSNAEATRGIRLDVEQGDTAADFDGNLDEQSSVTSSSPGVRSPRYFNFMRVKRAKQRARKFSSTPNNSTASCLEHQNAMDDDSRLVDPNQVCTDEEEDQSNTEGRKAESVNHNSNVSDTQTSGSQNNAVGIESLRVSDRIGSVTANSLPKTGSPSGVAPISIPNQNFESFMNVAHSLHQPHSADARAVPMKTETKRRDFEEDSSKHSKRIRFRNPFPIVKPQCARRDPIEIIMDHVVPLPEIPIRWVKPKKELRQLIVAAMGTSLARRSNACGALKVLTRHKKNQMTLVRTDGFLTALTFAVTQAIGSEDRDLAVDARTRAVAALRNVCIPKDNRVLILKHPGIMEALVHVLEMETGEGRAIAAGAIALLCKTPSCRDSLAQAEGLIDILGKVLHSGAVEVEAVTNHSRGMHDLKGDSEEADVDHSSSKENDDISTGHTDTIKVVDSFRNQAVEKRSEYISESRASSCAALLHLSKHCSVSDKLCTNVVLLDSLVKVANEASSPLHSKCLEIICNLSRFPANNGMLSRYDKVIETLVAASTSSIGENRLNALRALQNMSSDPGSKSLLATSQVLTRMISCAMRKDAFEKEVAVATIYNISTEPSAVASITNTKNVVATLVHLAHSPDSSSEVRLLACESLSTISLWLQTLAGTGKVPEGVSNVPLPSQKTSGWQRWD